MHNHEHLGMYVTIASMYIRRNLDSLITQESCSSGIQGRILAELVHAEAQGIVIYQKDVEKMFGIRRSSVNSLISSLESHGFVDRIQDKQDARLKQLILTEKGRQQHHQICQLIDGFEHALDSEFSPEEKKLVISMMQRIIRHYEDNGQNTSDRKESAHD